MSNPKKFLPSKKGVISSTEDSVRENRIDGKVTSLVPTVKINESLDQFTENCTADNIYSVYKNMDCEDKYTNSAQKYFLLLQHQQPYLLR